MSLYLVQVVLDRMLTDEEIAAIRAGRGHMVATNVSPHPFLRADWDTPDLQGYVSKVVTAKDPASAGTAVGDLVRSVVGEGALRDIDIVLLAEIEDS